MPGMTALTPEQAREQLAKNARDEQRARTNRGVNPFLALRTAYKESLRERKPLIAGTYRAPSLTARVSKP